MDETEKLAMANDLAYLASFVTNEEKRFINIKTGSQKFKSFSLSLRKRPNNLECLSLANIFSLE